MTWRDRIQFDPTICHGKPCVRGTRVLVSTIFDNLAAGESVEAIVRGYHIESDDIRAALTCSADRPKTA